MTDLWLISSARRSFSYEFEWRWHGCNVSDRIVLYFHSNSSADPRNTDCDYSSAYISLLTNSDLVGHGMTFTIGRGNDIVSAQITLFYFKDFYLRDYQVCAAIGEVANRLVGKEVEALFANMGKTWDYLLADSQLRW